MKPRSKHLFNLAVFTSPMPSSLYKSLMKRAEKIQITSESKLLKFWQRLVTSIQLHVIL